MDRQPNLFILGAPKCGTTSLANWLGQHSQVYLSPVKEPHHYNSDEQHVYYPDREEYLRLYKAADEGHRYRLDASTWYLHSQIAVASILADCPHARFLVCLRNPVEMAFSLHSHLVHRTSREHVASFEKAWELSDERLEGRVVSRRVTDPRYLAYKYSCRIGSQSERLLKAVPREQVHFMVLDDLINDESRVLRDILDFLSLDNESELKVPKDNVKEARASLRLNRVVNDLVDIKSRIGMRFVSFGIGRALNRFNRRKYPAQMDAETRRVVTEYFSEEIRLIWKVTGEEYSNWLNSIKVAYRPEEV